MAFFASVAPRMPSWLLQRLEWGKKRENAAGGRCCHMIRMVALPQAPGFHLRMSPSAAPSLRLASADRLICSRGWASLECMCPGAPESKGKRYWPCSEGSEIAEMFQLVHFMCPCSLCAGHGAGYRGLRGEYWVLSLPLKCS